MGLLNSILKIFVGNKAKKDLSKIYPIVNQINSFYKSYNSMSNDNLRDKTNEFKERIINQTNDLKQEIKNIEIEIQKTDDLNQKEILYQKIDEIENTLQQKISTTLDKILPEAFALVKETCRRFLNHSEIQVKATEFDRILSQNNDFIQLKEDNAIWSNSWDAAGKPIVWDMVHYDVQLIGGIALHQGKISEMQTGEGKTLAATLPIYLNALTGKGVHLVTVNDYLAKRDSSWMGPIFQFHGLSIDCIDYHKPNSQERRKAYKADITYGTNNEFGFDYLRDNMAHAPEDLVQRKHHYAIIDEVDSVLIDDARTPLIISGPTPKGERHEFDELKPKIADLVSKQRKLLTEFLHHQPKRNLLHLL